MPDRDPGRAANRPDHGAADAPRVPDGPRSPRHGDPQGVAGACRAASRPAQPEHALPRAAVRPSAPPGRLARAQPAAPRGHHHNMGGAAAPRGPGDTPGARTCPLRSAEDAEPGHRRRGVPARNARRVRARRVPAAEVAPHVCVVCVVCVVCMVCALRRSRRPTAEGPHPGPVHERIRSRRQPDARLPAVPPDEGRTGCARVPRPAARAPEAHPRGGQGAAARRGRRELDAMGTVPQAQGIRSAGRDRVGRENEVQPHATGHPEDPRAGRRLRRRGRRRAWAGAADPDRPVHRTRLAPAHAGEPIGLPRGLPDAPEERARLAHRRQGRRQRPGTLQARRRICRPRGGPRQRQLQPPDAARRRPGHQPQTLPCRSASRRIRPLPHPSTNQRKEAGSGSRCRVPRSASPPSRTGYPAQS